MTGRQRRLFLHSGTQAEERLSFRVFGNIWASQRVLGTLDSSVLMKCLLPRDPERKMAGRRISRPWSGQDIGRPPRSPTRRPCEQWPLNASVWIGLGKQPLHALHDLNRSGFRLPRSSPRKHPESGIAYNNLAQVLAETGEVTEAMEAARQAVAIGGPLQEHIAKPSAPKL